MNVGDIDYIQKGDGADPPRSFDAYDPPRFGPKPWRFWGSTTHPRPGVADTIAYVILPWAAA